MRFIRFSKRFKKRHPILTKDVDWEFVIFDVILFGMIVAPIKFVILPILERILFLFTPYFYTRKIERKLFSEAETTVKHTIEDLRHQITLLTRDRDDWKVAWQEQHKQAKQNYADGIQRGIHITEKRFSKQRKTT